MIAVVAYGVGSMSSTMVIASNFVFRTSLRRLGKGNVWLSNFRRIYGVWGAVRLLLTELVKDALPILFGALLLGFKGHADVGRAFAGLCLVLGRLYPLFYDFKGSHATVCMICMGLFINPSLGIAAAVVAAAVTWFSRYVALGTLAGTLVLSSRRCCWWITTLSLSSFSSRRGSYSSSTSPQYPECSTAREFRLSFEEDITYKLDQKF